MTLQNPAVAYIGCAGRSGSTLLLQSDEEWHAGLSERDRRLTTTITLPLLPHYRDRNSTN